MLYEMIIFSSIREWTLVSPSQRKFLSFLLFIQSSVVVSSFNIEERDPVIKRGPTGSLFGVAIAEHYISTVRESQDDSLLLVGAPTYSLSSGGEDRPGALFKCDVSLDSNCTLVDINPAESRNSQLTSGQWLGVTVKSSRPGGQIAVCAHRYAIRGTDWIAPIGRCFLLNNDATPLADGLSFEYLPCEGKTDRNGDINHEGFGYCQAGASIDFATTGKYNYLVIGTPGTNFWRGSLYARRQDSNDGFGLSVQNMWANTEQIITNGLAGSSVVTGHLYTRDTLNFISGAPGANATGAVFIFERKTNSDVGLYLNAVEVVEGDRVASRFGHDVILVDVTGDGKLELIVSAPQYHYNTSEAKVGGAVYIYINEGLKHIGPNWSQILHGKVDSYFGMSIADAGDVNMDGVGDIVIGAPGDYDWEGAIYIYHGDSGINSTGVHLNPAQVIRASILTDRFQFRGFGYSLSAGLDMDGNAYPDIAVGSLSDSAVMLLSRPVVNIMGDIEVPAKQIELTITKSQTFEIKICLNYTASPLSFDERVQATGFLLLDTAKLYLGRPSRLTFANSSSSSNKTFNMALYPQSQKRDRCKIWKTYLQSDVTDKLSPILIQMEFTTSNSVKRRRRQSAMPVVLPIMNAATINSSQASISFAKECGPDEICKSNLKKTAYYQVYKNGNWTNLKQRNGEPLLVLGTEEQIGMVVEVTNKNGEDAHQAKMSILLPEEVTYRGVKKLSATAVRCARDGQNNSLVLCQLGNPLKGNRTTKFKLKLSKDKSIYKATDFVIQLQLLTTSQQVPPDPGTNYKVLIEVEAQLELIGYSSREQVNFAGEVIGESAVKKPSDAGTVLFHRYEVSNSGTGVVEDVSVTIKWPQSIKNGKYVFYLLGASVDFAGNCTLPVGVNPLNLAIKSRRKRRESGGALSVRKSLKKDSSGLKDYAELNCLTGDLVSCVEITCNLQDLYPSVPKSINLDFILWNGTFLEEFENCPGLNVDSSAKISISQDNVKFSDDSVLHSNVTTTVLPREHVILEQPIEWWIIAMAGAAGVLLLVLLVFILWKCGFFKRQKMVDYQKARKHKQASKKAEEKESLY